MCGLTCFVSATCVCTHVCKVCAGVYTCQHIRLEARDQSCVLYHSPPCALRWGLFLHLELVNQPDWLPSEAQRPSCLHWPPMLALQMWTLLFMWVLRILTQVLMPNQLTEPSPQPLSTTFQSLIICSYLLPIYLAPKYCAPSPVSAYQYPPSTYQR